MHCLGVLVGDGRIELGRQEKGGSRKMLIKNENKTVSRNEEHNSEQERVLLNEPLP